MFSIPTLVVDFTLLPDRQSKDVLERSIDGYDRRGHGLCCERTGCGQLENKVGVGLVFFVIVVCNKSDQINF